MTESVRDSIYDAIASIRLIDPHTHINPHSPSSDTLADLLGYHYYTELAHSAGMPKDQIEESGLDPRELVWRLVSNLSPVENTAQYRWLIEICRVFFGFEGDRIDQSNWEDLYDDAERQMRSADWPQMVLDQSNVEAVFLTNDFDDELTGFDTDTYIPCLRTDDLVFHLEKPETRERLAFCTGIELDGSLTGLRASLAQRFDHFVASGARACAISLPPTFDPTRVSDGRAATALDHVLRQGSQADPSHKTSLSRRVFWTLAELCDEYGLPFDLMIGVNRGVYEDGVYQGQDLYDSRVSLIQYRELFNSFPAVKFPISVLASVTNQELVSYSWIFPNVITNGHWWYSNTPSFIARDAAARLEAVPQTKQIAYYSDAYKLEFVWPKFDMYRRVLSGILADHFVKGCGWSEERAIELGRQVLRDNVDEIFPRPSSSDRNPESWLEHSAEIAEEPAAGAPAIGSFGTVDVDDNDEQIALGLDDVEQELLDDDAETDQEYVDFGTHQEYEGAEPDHEDDEFLAPAISLDPVQVGVDDAPAYTDDTSELELDPLPSVEEIQAVDVSDVELSDLSTESVAADADAIESEADPESLDLGDMFGEEEESAETTHPEIRMLRGEEAFEVGDESLQLQPDPLTGELTFPVPSSGEEPDVLDEPLEETFDEPVDDLLDAPAFQDDVEETPDEGIDDSDPTNTSDTEIRLMRGEESFELGEESLQLQPDPLTGELTFPVPSADEDPGVPEETIEDSLDEQLLTAQVEDAIDDDVAIDPDETIDDSLDQQLLTAQLEDAIDDDVAIDPDETIDDSLDQQLLREQLEGAIDDDVAIDPDETIDDSLDQQLLREQVEDAIDDDVAADSDEMIEIEESEPLVESIELDEQDEPVAADLGVSEQESSDDDAETSQEEGDLVTDQEEDEFSTTFTLSMPSLDPVAAASPQEEMEESPSSLDVPPEIESDMHSNGEEMQGDDVSDVELNELAAESVAPDLDVSEADADPEPFDLSEMLAEEDSVEAPQSEPDPSTGENLGLLDEAVDDEQPIDDSLDAPIDDTLDAPIDDSLHAPSFLDDVEDAIDDADLRDVDETIENNEGEPPVELPESDEQDDLDESDVR